MLCRVDGSPRIAFESPHDVCAAVDGAGHQGPTLRVAGLAQVPAAVAGGAHLRVLLVPRGAASPMPLHPD